MTVHIHSALVSTPKYFSPDLLLELEFRTSPVRARHAFCSVLGITRPSKKSLLYNCLPRIKIPTATVVLFPWDLLAFCARAQRCPVRCAGTKQGRSLFLRSLLLRWGSDVWCFQVGRLSSYFPRRVYTGKHLLCFWEQPQIKEGL